MKATIKTVAPILGGLLVGCGIADLLEGSLIGIPEVFLGVVLLGYTLYLILR